MENYIKVKLSLYGFISAISFAYLILQLRPGISVPLFIIIQFISIYYVVINRKEIKNNKGILMIIPIFILALNYFISGSYMWGATNLIVIIVLYSTMILIMKDKMSLDKLNVDFIFNIIANVFVPFTNFTVPFKWYTISDKNVIARLKIERILIGILISIPCVLFLLMMLSSADMIFSQNVASLSIFVNDFMNFDFVYKLILSTFVGFYLFGLLHTVFSSNEFKINSQNAKTVNDLTGKKQITGDLIIINILLFSILAVYTIFITIQFKYLFAGSELPNGLNFSEYARRGFFELVFLSVLNVGLILLTVFLLKEKIYYEKTKWSQITKTLLMYLCLLTGILLISSFYRMMLYDNEYGFTRLRILVYLFLIFEAAGLLITFEFILRPGFNIIAVYLFIGLIYYLTLNVVRIDNIIAKRNIDMYFESEKRSIDLDYLMSLSVDASPQIMRLFTSDDVDILTKYKSRTYLENIHLMYNGNEANWQNYNLSVERAKQSINVNIEKLQFN